jgi:hypothetical protein
MDEAKRFFRFILPGLSSLVEFVFFVWLLIPSKVVCCKDELKEIGTVVGLLVGSGALGFILSNLYHAVSWGVFRGALTINHKRLIERACKGEILKLHQQDGGAAISPETVSRRDSWRIATAIWHARIKISPRIEGANTRTDSLTSIVHGLGTLLIGTAVAAGFTVYLGYEAQAVNITQFRQHWGFLVGAGVLLLSQGVAFHVAVRHGQQVIDMILFEELRSGKPTVWYL